LQKIATALPGVWELRPDIVREALNLYSIEELLESGLADYILDAEPHTGAFVFGYNDHLIKQQYMNYFKMGDGPLYAFYTPYHLPHLQVVPMIARAALFHDPTVTPKGKPVCNVIAVAKRDLRATEVLDGIGGFTCYGTIDNSETVRKEDLLPMGLSEGCRLKRGAELLFRFRGSRLKQSEPRQPYQSQRLVKNSRIQLSLHGTYASGAAIR
jgi:predicted homoserine dehydrogenase-like protein